MILDTITKALQRFENACATAWEHDGRDCSAVLSRRLHEKADKLKEELVDAIHKAISEAAVASRINTAAGELIDESDDQELYANPEHDCPRCHGCGKVPTMDYESYFGAQYKPCPLCAGDPCLGEPPLT